MGTRAAKLISVLSQKRIPVWPVLAANETSRKAERVTCFAKRGPYNPPNGPQRRASFVNPGTFEDIHKTLSAFCKKPGFSQ